MTNKDLLAAYPHCFAAVLFCEVLLDGKSNGDESDAEMLEVIRHMGPRIRMEDLILKIREAVLEEVSGVNGVEAVARPALPQLDHPSFRTYLAAKLGLL